MNTKSTEDMTGDTAEIDTAEIDTAEITAQKMDTYQLELKLENLENFRQIPNTKLFRSARPDEASANDVKALLYLDIKCIIDCRDHSEMLKQEKSPLMDDYYGVYRYQNGQFNRISCAVGLNRKSRQEPREEPDPNKHYMIPIAHCFPYYRELFKRADPDIKCKILYYFVYDKVYKTHLTPAIATKHIVSLGGLIGLYRDMIEYCGTTILVGEYLLFMVVYMYHIY